MTNTDSNYLSDCHDATVYVVGDSFGEGTNHYSCSRCNQSCSFHPKENTDSPLEDREGKPVKYLSLFSGVGGFELGIGDRGECIGYSEIDKYAIKVYERNFNHENYGDARNIKLSSRQHPNYDFLCGGFPCQAFSVAGKRLGFGDTRGTLFYEIARLLRYQRPRHFLLENVKGLLSHDSGKTFQTILGVLADLGYIVEWQILNSKDFGVPQNRERVFIIGHLGNKCGTTVFPIINQSSNDTRISSKKKSSRSIAYTLDANYYKGVSPKGYQGSKRQLVAVEQATPDQQTKPNTNNANGGATRAPLRYLNRNQRNIEGDYAFTVDASQTSGIAIDMKIANAVTPDAYLAKGERKRVNGKAVLTSMHERRIRRLTPTECERLQGFPDGWTALGIVGFETVNDDPYGKILYEYISDTQRYKMMGNAVTVNVVDAVITAMCNEGCLQEVGIS